MYTVAHRMDAFLSGRFSVTLDEPHHDNARFLAPTTSTSFPRNTRKPFSDQGAGNCTATQLFYHAAFATEHCHHASKHAGYTTQTRAAPAFRARVGIFPIQWQPTPNHRHLSHKLHLLSTPSPEPRSRVATAFDATTRPLRSHTGIST